MDLLYIKWPVFPQQCRRCGAFSGFASPEAVNLSGEAADCQGDRTGEDEEGGESPAETKPTQGKIHTHSQ